MTTIRRLAIEDAPVCDAIVAALPYFFGDPVGVRNAAKGVRDHENAGWVTEDEGRVTGFLSLAWSTSEAAEIAWMAVHPDYRRGGHGGLLVEQAKEYALENGRACCSSSHRLYRTRPMFRMAMRVHGDSIRRSGFVKLWVGGQVGWNQDHLLMVRGLG